jgi:hypothetical protein
MVSCNDSKVPSFHIKHIQVSHTVSFVFPMMIYLIFMIKEAGAKARPHPYLGL